MKRILRVIAMISMLVIVLNIFPALTADAILFTPNFELNSQSCILVNRDTNSVVFKKNSNVSLAPAQLVNIMTAIIALENCNDLDNTMVTMPSEIYTEFDTYRNSDPSIYITTSDFLPGEEISMTTLMYGMMLESSCEAASAIAYTIGGSNINTFIQMMNDKAAEIGAVNTHFVNAHGLYAEGQVTTAEDMIMITEYALSLPRFEDISTAPTYTVPASNKHSQAYTISHTNVMLDPESEYYYSGVKGIKTGNSTQSGRCVITEISKNGSNYLVVLMNAPVKDANGKNKFYHLDDVKALFDWAYQHLSYTTLITTEKEVAEVAVDYAEGNGYVLVKPAQTYATLWLDTMDTTTVQKNIVLNENVYAPIKKGDILGTMQLKVAGEELKKVDLIATSDVDRSVLKYNFAMAKVFYKSSLFKWAIVTSIILIIVYIALFIMIVNKYRKERRLSKKSIYTDKSSSQKNRKN